MSTVIIKDEDKVLADISMENVPDEIYLNLGDDLHISTSQDMDFIREEYVLKFVRWK